MTWSQVYDPTGSLLLSTILAALPVIVLLGAIGIFQIKAHLAALLGLVARSLVAILGFGMPTGMAGMSRRLRRRLRPVPIGWIILNVIFLYQLTEEKGDSTSSSAASATSRDDRRLQLLLIAFCFGAFFEGAAGFGTPVAVTAAMLIGLGFSPLAASGLSLIANTAPVAYGALGTPIIALAAVTGLDLLQLSGMVGRQLPFFSVIVPFWLIWAFVGFRGMLEVWPALLVAGVSFAIPQYPGLQLPRAVAGRRRGRHRLDGLSRPVPARLAAEERHDRGAARLVVQGPVDEPHEHPPTSSSRGAVMQGVAALADPLASSSSSGAPRRSSLPGWDLDRQASGGRPAQSGDEGATRRGRTARRGRGLQPQPALGHGHRHPRCRHHLGLRSGLQAGGAACACTGGRSTDPLLAAHHRLHAGAGLCHPLLGHRRHAWVWPSRRPAGSIPSSARCSAGSAWR